MNHKISTTIAGSLSFLAGVVSLAYYLSTNNGIVVSILSACIVFAVCFALLRLLFSALAGMRQGAKDAVGKSAQEQPAGVKEELFRAAGTHYYLQNIAQLATANPDWKKTGKTLAKQGLSGQRVYRYQYINKPVKLIFENDNPHDRNAVMVQIAGEKVGYISADEAPHVLEILSRRTVQFISAFVGGGDYKEIYEDGTFQRFSDEPFVRVKIRYK